MSYHSIGSRLTWYLYYKLVPVLPITTTSDTSLRYPGPNRGRDKMAGIRQRGFEKVSHNSLSLVATGRQDSESPFVKEMTRYRIAHRLSLKLVMTPSLAHKYVYVLTKRVHLGIFQLSKYKTYHLIHMACLSFISISLSTLTLVVVFLFPIYWWNTHQCPFAKSFVKYRHNCTPSVVARKAGRNIELANLPHVVQNEANFNELPNTKDRTHKALLTNSYQMRRWIRGWISWAVIWKQTYP